MEKQRIAVVGSGIAGLATAWMLKDRHDVTLFERNHYVGGHTHTHELTDTAGRPVTVDSGFIVFNDRNYPALTALFRELGVESRPSEMSFAVSLNEGMLEYSGSTVASLFAQRRNLASPSHYRMIWDILRFNRACKRDLARDGFGDLALDEYLAAQRLGRGFRDRYLLPMAAAIWSCPTQTMGRFPAKSLAEFFRNHGLLDLANRPQWRTVVGGSHSYVRRMLSKLGDAVHTGNEVKRVARTERDVALTLADGNALRFDQVILASHADESLEILTDASVEERDLLARFSYQPNRAVLHSDVRLMPKEPRVWSSWNYLARTERCRHSTNRVSVTYWMNRLQGLQTDQPFLVSLNPLTEPAPELVHAEMTYDHPVFDRAAMAAQPRLAGLQGRRRTWFCGSYFGYGFHEDALRSAVSVAQALGVTPAWHRSPACDAEAQDGPIAAPGLLIRPQES